MPDARATIRHDSFAATSTETARLDHTAGLEMLVSQLPVALYTREPGAGAIWRYVSPRFERLTGLGHADLPSDFAVWLQRVHPDDRKAVQAADDQAVSTGEPAHLEYRIRGEDDEWVWVDDSSVLTRDERGRPLVWHGTLLVISEQKRLEAALREKQAQLQTIIDSLPAALYRQNPPPHASSSYVNPGFASLLGFDPDRLPLGFAAFFERVHPDDRDAALQRAALSERTGEPFDLEYRLQRADGDWIWIHDRSVIERDAHGQPGAWTGVLLDITGHKQLESALQDSEVRFRRAFENTAIGMSLGTADHRWLDANAAYCRIVGVSRQELIGRPFAERTHPDDRERELELHARLRAGEIDSYQIEKRYPRPDGTVVTGALTVAAVRDARGALLYDIAQMQDITAQKVAEAALRESEDRFRRAFEGAGTGMSLTDPGGRIIDANPALCRMLGYSREELLGKMFREITHPADVDLSLASVQRVYDGKTDAYAIEKRYVRQDGQVVWAHLTSNALRDETGALLYIIAQIQDITARKEAEAALRESETRFRSIFEGAGIGMALTTATLEIVLANPALAEFLGYATDELIGMNIDDVTHPDDVPIQNVLRQRIRSGEHDTYQLEKRYIRKDGEIVWGLLNVTAVRDEQGAIQSFIGQVQDIADRKRAELATKAALQTQEAAIKELERLNQSKSHFLATISHEFRTPLTAIIGYSELLAGRSADPASVADDVAVIHREASRLSRMVDDLLLVDQADSGRLRLQTAPVDLNDLVRDVAGTMRPLADRHQFALDLDPALRPIAGDRDRLSQALSNLIGNAVKYSPDGGEVAIATRNDGAGVHLTVRDDGIGIAADDLPRIFGRFERVESGTSGRIAGAGLGLAIAREIVELHGGRLWAESEPGSGSTFHLVLLGDGKTARRQVGKSVSRKAGGAGRGDACVARPCHPATLPPCHPATLPPTTHHPSPTIRRA